MLLISCAKPKTAKVPALTHLEVPVGVVDEVLLVLVNQHAHHIRAHEPEPWLRLSRLLQHKGHPVHRAAGGIQHAADVVAPHDIQNVLAYVGGVIAV